MYSRLYARKFVWFFVLVLCGAAVLAAVDTWSQNGAAGEDPPLRLDSEDAAALMGTVETKEEPLRLDGDEAANLLGANDETSASTEVAPESGMAYYIFCHDCHVNYVEEELALTHAKAGMSCKDCHGESRAHYSDESNTTPPDTMIPHEDVATFCVTCHETHNAPASAVIALWQERAPIVEPAALMCTDCHGTHRLPLRHVEWDKRTGELLKK